MFIGGVAVLLILLLLVFICIKKGLCCQPVAVKETERNYIPLYAEEMEEENDFSKPYNTKPVYHQFKLGNSDSEDFHYPGSDPTVGFNSSDTDAISPSEYDEKSVKTGLSGLTKSLNLSSQNLFLDNCQLRVSLLYSKADLFLMVSINEVTGITTSNAEQIRISAALLPEKKYRSKTKYAYVTDETSVIFNDSFKFSNVSRESLFSSAFRFRLYGKKKYKKEYCYGEIIIQLADVAQRAGGFMTWRTFEPKGK